MFGLHNLERPLNKVPLLGSRVGVLSLVSSPSFRIPPHGLSDLPVETVFSVVSIDFRFLLLNKNFIFSPFL